MPARFPALRLCSAHHAPRSLCAAFALACALGHAVPAWADDADPGFAGLLRVRDLTPFGFRRLDMRPSQAAFAPAGSASIEVDVGYQNTWSLSRGAEDTLRRRTSRGPLTAQDAAAIRALPGENYLLDLELGLVDVAFNTKLTERVGAYAVLSAARYTGGFLDGFVEGFHRAFGLGDATRPRVTRNRINVLLDLRGEQIEQIDMADNSGVLDPVFGLRYTFARHPRFGHLVLDTAIKVPLGRDGAFSTNRFDVGLQLSGHAFLQRHAFYASAGLVWYRGSALPAQDAMLVPTGLVGYEYRFTAHDNVLVQFYASRSVFTARQTELAELRGNKYLLSLGWRHRVRQTTWTAALTENLRHFNNTPDIGFQFGVAMTFP